MDVSSKSTYLGYKDYKLKRFHEIKERVICNIYLNCRQTFKFLVAPAWEQSDLSSHYGMGLEGAEGPWVAKLAQ